MKVLKLIAYTILFFTVGETLIRIDMHYDLLNNAPKKIEIKTETSQLLKIIDDGQFVIDSSQIRILVIGDSYIHGGGINPSDKFSKKLSMLLKEDSFIEKEYLVLDVSRPSNNSLDNYNSFIHYQKQFKPHFIFWAYNFNDILGKTEITKKESNQTKNIKSPPTKVSKKRVGLKSVVKQIYSASELTRYISTNVQKELKTRGVVVPLGDFHYLTKKAYLETSKNWQNTKDIFNEVSYMCELNNSQFILYKMPEFNLLHKPDLFSLIDDKMTTYSNLNKDIIYIDGQKNFSIDIENTLKISKYDGHPNELAHLKIAESIAKFITTKTNKNHYK